jgi:hypothetical protein
MPSMALLIARGYIRPRCQRATSYMAYYFQFFLFLALTIPLTSMALVQLCNDFVLSLLHAFGMAMRRYLYSALGSYSA